MSIKQKLLKLAVILFLFIGCANDTQTAKINVVKKDAKVTTIQQKVAKAFNNAQTLKKEHSKWFDRDEKVPLTIIATAYIDPKAPRTKEYQLYKAYAKIIAKNPSILGKEISSKFSSIKFVDYSKSEKAKNKFNASYNYRYKNKKILTDILRPDTEKPSAEILIRLNYEELKKGNLTIEGYKTIKQKNLKRNSYYYTLRKVNYNKLSQKEKQQAIFNSIKAVLQLSIPEYVSIDRKKLIKDGEVIRFITQNSNGEYNGEVWRYTVDDRIKKVKEKLQNIENKYIKILIGHTSDVMSVAISPDGKYVLSGSANGTVRYWDLKTGKTIEILYAHTDVVTSVAISPDGKYALSGSDDKTLRYWDLKTGKTLKILKGHTDYVWSVAISPDGKYALSGSWDRTLRYWNLSTGKTIKILKGHTDYVWSVAISPDGKYALSGSRDKTLRYWDLDLVKMNGDY
jgi:WD40 repeat protein